MAEELAEIFDAAQRNQSAHKSSVAKLRTIKDRNPRLFVKNWLDLLNRILVESKKHQSVDRLVKFVALVSCSFDETFRDFNIQYVIRKTDSSNWAPRFRACQILSTVLKHLPEEAELGDSIWDEINMRMRDRLDDRAPAVRAEAVCAIQRLQDPSDAEDPIIWKEDPSGDVRKTVICNVAICKATLKEVVARTRDVHPPARRAAFRVLSNYVNVRNLTISQRTSLLADGLSDRDEKVQRECGKMCLSWLSNCDNDILDLLRLVDVELAEEGAEKLLKVIFRDAQGGSVRVDPKEKLSSEAALYMRVISEHWKTLGTEVFEAQVPELVSICSMMEENSDNDYVLKQLLTIAGMRDFADEAGRVNLSALLRSMLPSPHVSQFLVEPIIKVLSMCHADELEFIQVVLEVVSDVREPLDLLQTDEARVGFQKALRRRDEMRVVYAKLKKVHRISLQNGQQEQAKKAAAKAEALKAELEAAEESISTRSKLEEHIWYRVLCITELMLESTKQSLRHPGIMGLLGEVLMPSLAQTSLVIREKALRCLALYCLLDRTAQTVKTHISVFLQSIANDEGEVRLTAIKSLFDLGMVYGFSSFEEHELSERLSKYVTDESEDHSLRSFVVEGFAKLYLMGQCKDVDMLGHLLLLFFAPSTSSDFRLRQCLSVFFPTFAFTSKANQDLCFEAAVPALRRILLSDPSSSWRKIDWTLFCKFVAHLTSVSNSQYEVGWIRDAPSWHEQIMLQISYEMRGEEKSLNQFWARALSHFHMRDPFVAGDEDASLARLRFAAKVLAAVEEGIAVSSDKRAQQWIQKRATAIREVITGGAVRELFTEELWKECQDDMEVEVEMYLEKRAEDVRRLLSEGRGFSAMDSMLMEEEQASPPKKKKPVVAPTKKRDAAAPAAKGQKRKEKTKTPKKVATWGISVAGETAAKKARSKKAKEAAAAAVAAADPLPKLDLENSPVKAPPSSAMAKKSISKAPPSASVRKSARKRKEVDYNERDDEEVNILAEANAASPYRSPALLLQKKHKSPPSKENAVADGFAE